MNMTPIVIGAGLLLLLKNRATAAPIVGTKTTQPVVYRTPTDVAGELARTVAATVYGIVSSPTAQTSAAAALDYKRESGANAVKWGDPYYSGLAINPGVAAANSPVSLVEAIQYSDAIAAGPAYNPGTDIDVQSYYTGSW